MKRLILFLALAALSSVNADVRQGELFGYRLGDRYPMTAYTRSGLSGTYRFVEAEAATKPDIISSVVILTLPKSLRIVAIAGSRSFFDMAQARRFFHTLSAMLASRYLISWRDSRTEDGVEAILAAKFRLQLYVQPQPMGGAKVFVSLARADMRDLAAQALPFLRGF